MDSLSVMNESNLVARAVAESGISQEELYEIVLDKMRKFLGYPLPPEAVSCLEDRDRTLKLMDIIKEITERETTAVDLGAGSGILGFAFLNAGGDFLYSVDSNLFCTMVIKEIASELGLLSRIEIYKRNAISFIPPTKVDYVIAELVGTGLASEQAVEVMCNIRNHANPGALFFPETAVSSVKLAAGNEDLSDSVEYDSVHFPTNERRRIDRNIRLIISREGVPTRAVLQTYLLYSNGQRTGEYSALCNPLEVKVRVTKQAGYVNKYLNLGPRENPNLKIGDVVELNLAYRYGIPIRPKESFKGVLIS